MTVAPQRKIIQELMHKLCNSYNKWLLLPQETRDTYIRRMERNCFTITINTCIQDGIDRLFTEKKFIDRYSTICNKVLANLYTNSIVGSDYMITGLIEGRINPSHVAQLTSCELCPAASEAERNEIQLRQTIKVANKVSKAYKCKKCGCNETIPITYQSRASDEDSSRSIKCIECEFVWRLH
jgi:DNA-directed RNA polymerase subunit M/transcription elongation factor TFIIS